MRTKSMRWIVGLVLAVAAVLYCGSPYIHPNGILDLKTGKCRKVCKDGYWKDSSDYVFHYKSKSKKEIASY